MKKNISINLFGTLYAIDEDAYTLLERYLNSMKSYFARQQGGEEIADDIEHRVAELLWQQKQQGMEAVNIDMVKGIIAKIGNPAEIAGDEAADQAPTDEAQQPDSEKPLGWGNARFRVGGFRYNFKGEKVEYDESNNYYDRLKARIKNRYLYRDPQNRLLGGVLSGLANYFDTGDPLWWRLGFTVLSLMMWYCDIWGLLLPILYTAFWIILPEVRTPEDRLRMMGRDVNPENLNEQILHDSANASAQEYYARPSDGSKPLKVLFGILLAVFLFPLGILLLIFFVFAILVTSVFGGFISHLLPFDVADNEWSGLPEFVQTNSTNIWFLILFGLLTLGIPLYLIVRRLFMHTKPMSVRSKVAVLIVWLISLAMMVLTMVNNGVRLSEFLNTHHSVTYQYEYDSDNEEELVTDTIAADTTAVITPDTQPTDSL